MKGGAVRRAIPGKCLLGSLSFISCAWAAIAAGSAVALVECAPITSSPWGGTMPRVLIVDDEENQRRSLTIALRLNGFDVLVAASGSDALKLLASQQVHVALIDLMMPGLNGLDLARLIR